MARMRRATPSTARPCKSSCVVRKHLPSPPGLPLSAYIHPRIQAPPLSVRPLANFHPAMRRSWADPVSRRSSKRMSFYTSLSGLKGAQSDLSTISNNVANVGSTAFKKSRAEFGDIFAAGSAIGQGVRTNVSQQFTQGTLEATDKTLDLAITGEGFFTVSTPPSNQIGYTRNGAFSLDEDRYVVDTTGSRLQVLPVDAAGSITGTSASDLTDLVVPTESGGLDANGNPIPLSGLDISQTGLVTATFADGSTQALGNVAMASFPSQEGLLQGGDAHTSAERRVGKECGRKCR